MPRLFDGTPLAGWSCLYERTLLREATDPNLLYDLQNRLDGFHLFTEAEVEKFAAIYFDPKGTQDKLQAVLAPVVNRYQDAPVDAQSDFRGCLVDYVRLYAFLSQVITFTDPDLEKLYVLAKLLWRVLPVNRDPLPVEVQQKHRPRCVPAEKDRQRRDQAGEGHAGTGADDAQRRRAAAGGHGAALGNHQ